MPLIRVEDILAELQKKQPIFHSEADFQHALAWEIHTHHPNATVRLEIYPGWIGPREYIDIWVKHEDAAYAIELKPPRRRVPNDPRTPRKYRARDRSPYRHSS